MTDTILNMKSTDAALIFRSTEDGNETDIEIIYQEFNEDDPISPEVATAFLCHFMASNESLYLMMSRLCELEDEELPVLLKKFSKAFAEHIDREDLSEVDLFSPHSLNILLP